MNRITPTILQKLKVIWSEQQSGRKYKGTKISKKLLFNTWLLEACCEEGWLEFLDLVQAKKMTQIERESCIIGIAARWKLHELVFVACGLLLITFTAAKFFCFHFQWLPAKAPTTHTQVAC